MTKRMSGFTLIELLIVVAIIAILAAIAVPNFLEAQTRSKVSRVRADQRSLATAIEAYYLDNNSYPAMDTSEASHFGANNLPNASTNIKLVPTFRVKNGAIATPGDALMTLTTPIAYITSYFSDPFADTKGGSFMYSPSRGPRDQMRSGWILWSFGPDTDEKTSSAALGGDLSINAAQYAGVDKEGQGYIDETTYNPNGRVPSEALINRSYDPSNGTTSEGDVWRVKQ